MGVPVLLLFSIIFGSDAGRIAGFDLNYTDAQGEAVTREIKLSVADLIQSILLAVVTVLLWVNWDGRTPGKKLTGTRIVSYPEYGDLSYRSSTVRMLAAVASAIPFFLGYAVISLMVGLREDKRGYHDLLARTCVVHDR
jgi:uncharacterized RDD family membrane protein YckC